MERGFPPDPFGAWCLRRVIDDLSIEDYEHALDPATRELFRKLPARTDVSNLLEFVRRNWGYGQEWARRALEADPRGKPPPIPIYLIGQGRGQLEQVATALSIHPSVFRQGSRPVHVILDPPTPRQIDGQRVATLLIRPTKPSDVWRLTGNVCQFLRLNEEGVPEEADITQQLCKALTDEGEWPHHRRLVAVAEAPTMLPDGRVLEQAGYDRDSGVLFRPPVEFPPIPPKPSRDDARRAAGPLMDLVRTFPFANDHHKAAWLAATLTLLARPAFAHSPAFLVMAPLRGSGKTYLTKLSHIVACGRNPPLFSWPKDRDKDEMRKLLYSLAREGHRVAIFDNLPNGGAFGHPDLDQAITAGTIGGRQLGFTKVGSGESFRAVVFATGNNVSVQEDTLGRTVPIFLEPQAESPDEERFDFDPEAHAMAEWPRLAVAGLTILRAFDQAGRPRPDSKAWRNFTGWVDLIRNAVVWATDLDPLATRNDAEEVKDAGARITELLVLGWAELPYSKSRGHTAAEAIDLVKRAGDGQFPILRTALAEIAATERPGSDGGEEQQFPKSRTLGDQLSRARKKPTGGYKIDSLEDPHSKVKRWRMLVISDRIVAQ